MWNLSNCSLVGLSHFHLFFAFTNGSGRVGKWTQTEGKNREGLGIMLTLIVILLVTLLQRLNMYSFVFGKVWEVGCICSVHVCVCVRGCVNVHVMYVWGYACVFEYKGRRWGYELTSLVEEWLRLHGTSKICSVPPLSPTASISCLAEDRQTNRYYNMNMQQSSFYHS